MTAQPRGKTRPCPACGALIWPGDYACARDWRRLPAGHRTAILRAWGRRTKGVKGADTEHETAKADAAEWFAAHPHRSEGDPQ